MTDGITTNAEITWCPGCGNFGILNAFKKAVKTLEDKGITRDTLMLSSGIGCHGKIIDYLAISGLYSIHGRSVATVEGMKLGNPQLKTIAFGGDGDSYGEGLAHLIFAAKRNADITVFIHNNGAYALTTGQYSPTSQKGFTGPSTPEGSVEDPLNPLSLLLEAGATFVARGYAGKIKNLSELMVEAIVHEGFAIVDVLQPSVVFNNTYKEYNELCEIVEKTPGSLEEALALSKEFDERIPIGVFYQIKKPVFHAKLMGDWNPVKHKVSSSKRREQVSSLL